MFSGFSCYGIIFLALNVPSGAFILDVAEAPREVVHQIFVTNGGPYGVWGPKQFCPNGTYATGYKLKIEGDQGDGDDTSLNGITLICGGESGLTGEASSTVGPWGSVLSTASCPSQVSSPQYLISFQMNVEANQGFGDDTTANDIRFKCRGYDGGDATPIDSHPATPHWGSWGTYSAPCPNNAAICGLSTKVEGKQDIGFVHRDDSALNDVAFFCCSS